MTQLSTPRRPGRARTFVACWVAAAAALQTGCATSEERFCDQMSEHARLDDLRSALRSGDVDAAIDALANLRRTADIAPAEINEPLQRLVDALVELVRLATKSAGPDGETTAVDVASLQAVLDRLDDPSEQVERYVADECGVDLTP